MEKAYRPFNPWPWLLAFLALGIFAVFAVVGGGGFPTNPLQCNRFLWHTILAGIDPQDPQNGYSMAASASKCVFPELGSDIAADYMLLSQAAPSSVVDYGIDPLAPGRPDHPTLQWLRTGKFGLAGTFADLPQGMFGDGYTLVVKELKYTKDGPISFTMYVNNQAGDAIASIDISNNGGKYGQRLMSSIMNDFPETTPGFGVKLLQTGDAMTQGLSNITGVSFQRELYLYSNTSKAVYSSGNGGLEGFFNTFGYTRIPDRNGHPAAVKFIAPYATP